MVPVRVLLALLAAAAAFAVAGCGGSDTASSTASSATLAPADAGAWISIDTDIESAQWLRLEGLLARIPGGEQGLADLLGQAAGKQGLSWKDDIQPALGPELVLVLPAGSENPVLLTQPDDAGKLEKLLAKGDQPGATADVEGWTAAAETKAALDTYRSALDKGLLVDVDAFARALEGLPDEALARVYLDGTGLSGAVGRAAGSAGSLGGLPGLSTGTSPASVPGTIAMAVSAEETGLRIEGSVKLEGADTPASFKPTLLARVPADALVAVTFKGGEQVGRELGAVAGGEDALKQLQALLGVTQEDIASLFEGQGAVYVRPGAPIPEITLALETVDDRPLRTVDRIMLRLTASSDTKLTTSQEDGITVKRVELQPGLALSYASFDRTLFLTTSAAGIRGFRSAGEKLTDTADFARAAEDVSLGEMTSGFAYLDVDGLLPLVQGLAGATGAKADLGGTEALEAFDSAALNASAEGGTIRFAGFVRVG